MVGILYKVSLYSATALTYSTVGNTPIVQNSIWNQEACLPRWQSCQKAEPRFEPRSNWFRRRQWQPTLVLLPGKFHGWRSLVGCSPWGREESDTTEQLHFNFSLYLFIYFPFIYLLILISWRLLTLQYCSGFCHTLK